MASLICPQCGTKRIFAAKTKDLVCKTCSTKLSVSVKDGVVSIRPATKKDAPDKMKLPETPKPILKKSAPVAPELVPVAPAKRVSPPAVEISRSFEPMKRGNLELDQHLNEFIVFSKRVVTFAAVAVGLVLVVGTFGVMSYVKSMRLESEKTIATQLQSIRIQASELAALEVQSRLEKSFQEQNIASLVEAATQKKVAQAIDQQVQEAVTKAMASMQEEINSVGRIAEAGSRLRIGLRTGLVDLVDIQKNAPNEAVKERAASLLKAVAKDYEDAAWVSMKAHNATNVVQFLRQISDMPKELDLNSEKNLVECVHKELDMGCVALAFLALREKTGVAFNVFDIEQVEVWLKSHPELAVNTNQ